MTAFYRKLLANSYSVIYNSRFSQSLSVFLLVNNNEQRYTIR